MKSVNCTVYPQFTIHTKWFKTSYILHYRPRFSGRDVRQHELYQLKYLNADIMSQNSHIHTFW